MTKTADYLLTTYGPMLTHEQVAKLFHISREHLSKAITVGQITLPSKFERPGLAFHYLDVAIAIDRCATSQLDAQAVSAYTGKGSANQSVQTQQPPQPPTSQPRKAGRPLRAANRAGAAPQSLPGGKPA